MNLRFVVFLFLMLVSLSSHAQSASELEDYTWWNKRHNYDGFSPWTNYLTTSAAYFGPSALPVPALNRSVVDTTFRFEIRPEYHYSSGDQTRNIFTSLKIPLASRVDFEVFIVPLEYFSLDTLTRYQRAVRHLDAKGFSGGDFWFGTNFQLLRQDRFKFDFMASFYFKTASGLGIDYARYTDAPGYYINFQWGRNFAIGKNKKQYWRWYGQAGFYAYETYDELHNQNDCIIYGLGISYQHNNWLYRSELYGYYGYLNIGDRPALLKARMDYQCKKMDYALYVQQGLNDFDYTSIGFSFVMKFGKTFKP